MAYNVPSHEELDDWHSHPVTECLRDLLAAELRLRQHQAKEAYWAGRPWPKDRRLALREAEALLARLFRARADEWQAMRDYLEEQSEYERH